MDIDGRGPIPREGTSRGYDATLDGGHVFLVQYKTPVDGRPTDVGCHAASAPAGLPTDDQDRPADDRSCSAESALGRNGTPRWAGHSLRPQ